LSLPSRQAATFSATGSEVGIAAEAVRNLAAKGKKVRLVSMPSTTTFERQDDAYKQSVLPRSVVRRVAVEAGSTEPWWQYVGLQGEIVGIDHFGVLRTQPSRLREERRESFGVQRFVHGRAPYSVGVTRQVAIAGDARAAAEPDRRGSRRDGGWGPRAGRVHANAPRLVWDRRILVGRWR